MTNRHSQAHLSRHQIAEALAPFGISLPERHLEAIARYVECLIMWNQSVSLTSLDDPLEIVARHFGESLFVTQIIPIKSGRLADLGSGAGFPGLPLKILCPELDVVLLEANSRKCAFLTEIIGILNLSGVRVIKSRYEEFRTGPRAFSFICSRAIGDYRRLLRWSREMLKEDGRVILWLGEDDSIRIGRTDGWIWDVPTRIPESRRRVILSGRVSG
jgi:16S rRNA (guanine527-N7)-methyltransferase